MQATPSRAGIPPVVGKAMLGIGSAPNMPPVIDSNLHLLRASIESVKRRCFHTLLTDS
jgi:hypothetical protein